MDDENLYFGKALARLLSQRGLSAADVARATGLSRQAVYQILSGKTRSPKRATLERIAAFLGVTPAALLRDAAATPEFLTPDAEILAQIPPHIGPELAAMIERELPDAAPLRLDGPAEEARQDILKMKLYLILKKRKLEAAAE
jgi:transcriptional regulator with XRE-family HTH domain